MKTMINFSTSPDDLMRYSSADELQKFYQEYGCSGLELMPLGDPSAPQVHPDMIVGVHMCCLNDWMTCDRRLLLENYQKDLEYAKEVQAEYVVFHVTQVNMEECFTYKMQHTDEEVVDAACELINSLLDGKDYSFYFLMENLWWPGLNLLRPSITRRLLTGIHYPKKGLMLDTGHFLHTNLNLRTQKEALDNLHSMLDAHQDLLFYIKGIHLNQSLTGEYVQDWLKHPQPLDSDPEKRSYQYFEHVFQIDQHLPFTEPDVQKLIERISPLYLTYEYITKDKEEHRKYLQEGCRTLFAIL